MSSSSSSSSSSSILKIVIIGNGPCGLSLVHYLKDIIPLCNIDIIERNDLSGSPILYDCGAQIISQNVYESNISTIFKNFENEGIIKYIEDNMISSIINERPHGWNRATGQWKHYRCIEREKLFNNMKYKNSNNVTYNMGKVLNSIDINEDNEIILKLINNNDNNNNDNNNNNGFEEHIKCQKLIITTPAYETLRLVKTIPIMNSDDVLEVLDRCSKNYDIRYCKTIYVNKDSDVGLIILNKFHIENILELDATNFDQGDITLLSLGNSNNNDNTITLHIHAKSEESLNINYIKLWILSHWLHIDNKESFIIDEDDTKCFSQSRSCTAPLSPLREIGCIEVNSNIYLCGDYTVGSGTFSGAVLAAYKTSKVLMESLVI